METLFNHRWFRALYQIIVVGIICLPFRLIALMVMVFNTLLMPTSGVSVSDGFKLMFQGMVNGYKARAHWVKTGEVYQGF